MSELEKKASMPKTGATTATKRKAPVEAEVIDLCDSDDDVTKDQLQTPPRKSHPQKRIRLTDAAPKGSNLEVAPPKTSARRNAVSDITPLMVQAGAMAMSHAPSEGPVPQAPASPPSETSTAAVANSNTAPPGPETSIPTPENTPQKPKYLSELPQLDERYMPKIAIADGVVFTDPHKFSLKPAYFENWHSHDYIKLAERLRLSFDSAEFAREIGRPMEEINHTFSALVANPLYDAELAQKRRKEGLESLMELYREHGTVTRPWGQESKNGERVKRYLGELRAVGTGAVRICSKKGNVKVMKVEELEEGDVKYLEMELTKEDWATLWLKEEKVAEEAKEDQTARVTDPNVQIQDDVEMQEVQKVNEVENAHDSQQVDGSLNADDMEGVDKTAEVESFAM